MRKKKSTSLEELEDWEHFRGSVVVEILRIQMEAQLVYTTSKFEKSRFFEVTFRQPRPLPKICKEIWDNARDYFRTITTIIDI